VRANNPKQTDFDWFQEGLDWDFGVRGRLEEAAEGKERVDAGGGEEYGVTDRFRGTAGPTSGEADSGWEARFVSRAPD
jgi:hypothetical protein